jgi:hypothetical protein
MEALNDTVVTPQCSGTSTCAVLLEITILQSNSFLGSFITDAPVPPKITGMNWIPLGL